jgi:hypothetical protein
VARNNASYSFQIVVRQANGQPYDLTGRSLVMQFKNSTGSAPTGAATLQTSDGSIVVQNPAAAGIATGTLSATQMGLMAQGTWYWDMLDITNAGVPVSLGAGILPVRQGITNSTTPVMPTPGILLPGAGIDAIQVTAPGDSITLQLAPSGPPGSGASYLPQTAPSAPATGFLVYCDAFDGILKAISSNGEITDLALP